MAGDCWLSVSALAVPSPTSPQRWASPAPQPKSGLIDRSSRPRRTPHRTAAATEAHVCRLRQDRKLGPARIGPILGLPASTVHRILTRHGLNLLAFLDRPTGQPIRRYERDRPGELVHVDIKKLGRIPDGGGHKVLGRQAGRAGRSSVGFDYVHSAVDDHSRLAYSEIHPDEKAATCAAFLRRAAAFFHTCGIERVERGGCGLSRPPSRWERWSAGRPLPATGHFRPHRRLGRDARARGPASCRGRRQGR